MKTSGQLVGGAIYTGADLRGRFSIGDATINNGVFRPKGHDSIWLFVTERKTADRTQYSDLLHDDELEWDGQASGRTDKFIIEHADLGLELLVFYRRRKYEYTGAGFRYEGRFRYASHKGSLPAQFRLVRVGD